EFRDAALMLTALGVDKVKLMTNNPRKIKELTEAGIEVAEQVGTSAHVKDGNEAYLAAKVSRGSHMLDLTQVKK
ncbi:MAG: GTP cyclohydrolase, partial [Pseudomonadota bacterium]|nr:GTP cyclohydrolase [Pseudomonadota bacterium]